ncbi:MAG: ATP-binding cassette domain-containing protein [Arsenophonus sp. ET-DL9-MAG3]
MKKKSDNIIKIKNMSFILDQRPIFTNMNLTIPRGKITVIMGSSGIGKTTLLRLIGGQLRPNKGEILFDDINIPKLSRVQLYSTRKKMSMLFQSNGLFTDMNVFDNVAFPLRRHTALAEEIIRTVVIMKLEAVGLRGSANLMPIQLSGGMARRAAIARAIALDQQLILFDEPFVGQDPITMKILIKLIDELHHALNITCVIVSHDVQEVLSIANKAYIIGEQHIIAEGTAKELKQNNDAFVRQFLDGIANSSIQFNFSVENYVADLLR